MKRVALVAWFLPSLGCFSPNVPVGVGDTTSSSGGMIDETGDPQPGDTTLFGTSGGETSAADQTTDAADSGGTSSSSESGESTSSGGGSDCGDGMIGPGEVCDDGVNAGGYGGCEPGCGALGPYCGDQITQGVEDCDDGNAMNADGCNVDCVESGATLWVRTHDGDDHEDDTAFGVAVGPDDGVLVVGEVGQTPDASAAWAQLYGADGAESWSWSDSTPGGSVSARAAAVAPSGEFFICGGETGNASILWARRLDAAGNSEWLHQYEGVDDGLTYCQGLAVDEDATPVLAGYQPTLDDGPDIWVRRLDGDQGTEQWTRTFDNADGPDSAYDAEYTSDGDIVVVGRQGVPSGTDAWIRKYTANGAIDWTVTRDGGSFAGLYGVDSDVEGNVFVAGYESGPGGEVWNFWLAKYDGGGGFIWAVDEDFGPYDAAYGVAVDGTGAVAVVATLAEAQYSAWVAKFGPDGDMLWSVYPHADEADVSESFAWGVATDSQDRIVVVGSEMRDGAAGRDIWVQQFAP